MAEDYWAVWVTGGVEYDDFAQVKENLSHFPRGTRVLHGQAPGADSLADRAAAELGMMRVRVPYHGPAGKRGGPMRNRLIAQLLKGLELQGFYVIVLAFGGDRGTNNSIEIAKNFGFDIKEIDR